MKILSTIVIAQQQIYYNEIADKRIDNIKIIGISVIIKNRPMIGSQNLFLTNYFYSVNVKRLTKNASIFS